MLGAFKPDVVHIATEGPIGWSARGWCKAHKVPFTTAFHTRFPDYVAVRTGISAERFWPLFRHFHRESRAVLVASASLSQELEARGISGVRPWTRGIDQAQFQPVGSLHPAMLDLPHPILLNVGRVSLEKNLEAFLDLDFPGSKVVVGDGPALESQRSRYPEAIFLGALAGDELEAGAVGELDRFLAVRCDDPVLREAAGEVGGALDELAHAEEVFGAGVESVR